MKEMEETRETEKEEEEEKVVEEEGMKQNTSLSHDFAGTGGIGKDTARQSGDGGPRGCASPVVDEEVL